MLQLLWKVYCE